MMAWLSVREDGRWTASWIEDHAAYPLDDRSIARIPFSHNRHYVNSAVCKFCGGVKFNPNYR